LVWGGAGQPHELSSLDGRGRMFKSYKSSMFYMFVRGKLKIFPDFDICFKQCKVYLDNLRVGFYIYCYLIWCGWKSANTQKKGIGEEMKLAVLLLISLGVVLMVIQNTAPVQARFLWLTAEIPVIVLLFVTAVGGFVAGLLAAFLIKRGPQVRS
jgi:uncharacterized integral membrane protein